MTEIFKMPDIGEGMHEGEISNWLVKVGDVVKEDDPVAEVQNDKLLQEILSPYSGKVTKLFVEAGTTVEVGASLVEFDGSAEVADKTSGLAEVSKNEEVLLGNDLSADRSENPQKIAAEVSVSADRAPLEAAKAAENVLTKTGAAGRVLAMPSVRQEAHKLGVDLTKVPATGRHGHTTLDDLRNFASTDITSAQATVSADKTVVEQPKAPAAPVVELVLDRREPMNPTRKVVSRVMTQQHLTIPPVTNFDQVEVSKLVAHRAQFKKIASEQGIKLTYLAYVAKAFAATAHKFPDLNASVDYEKQEIIYHEHVGLGIAVNAPTGLYVPVIHEAENKSIFELAREISELAEAVRTGNLKPAQMQGSTLTISNIGSARGGWFTPIINGSDVAILGLGSIIKEPIVNADGELVVGQNMKLSMTYDHRLIDGMLAQTALNYLKSLLADPSFMLMEI